MHYIPNNRCLTCNNFLGTLSVNKGLRTPLSCGCIQEQVSLSPESNQDIDDVQCSDRLHWETYFYSDPLNPDITKAITTLINNTPSLANRKQTDILLNITQIGISPIWSMVSLYSIYKPVDTI